MRIDEGKLRPGQVVEAEPLAPVAERSVGALLRSRAERFGDKDAIRFRTRSGRWQELSFRQLDYLCRDGLARPSFRHQSKPSARDRGTADSGGGRLGG